MNHYRKFNYRAFNYALFFAQQSKNLYLKINSIGFVFTPPPSPKITFAGYSRPANLLHIKRGCSNESSNNQEFFTTEWLYRKAIRNKIYRGIWVKNIRYSKSRETQITINLSGIESWIQGADAL